MMRFVFSTRAKSDLLSIYRYIALHNPRAAEKVARKIYETCEQLCAFPHSGQSRFDLAPDMRHAVVGNYLVLYCATDTHIEIVRIIHAARYLPELL